MGESKQKDSISQEITPGPEIQYLLAGWTESHFQVGPGLQREPYHVDGITVVNGAVGSIQVTQNDHMAEKQSKIIKLTFKKGRQRYWPMYFLPGLWAERSYFPHWGFLVNS